MITVRAPAKLNLTLNVTGKNDAGFHLLNSIVSFCEFGDEITIMRSDDFELQITGPFRSSISANEDNLVSLAAKGFAHNCSRKPDFKIKLEKKIPVAAGLGGGSADAAAVIKAMCSLWDINPQDLNWLADFLLELGADVPMCFYGHSCRVGSVGEKVLENIDVPPYYVLLVNPNKACSTAEIFKNFQLLKNEDLNKKNETLIDQINYEGNDLTKAAIEIVPEIQTILNCLNAYEKCLCEGMSGSGASCFGLYESAEDLTRAYTKIKKTFPHFWAQKTRILQD